MKTTPIEKFQYLVHLKATNVHLFYRLLADNIKVSYESPHTDCKQSSRENRN